MVNKELKKLTRRELLQMLLIQCEESERLQKELDQLTVEHDTMMESYERLKSKLNVKDERLNQKDAKIAALTSEIKKMRESRFIELTEAGSIAEAALRLNGIFEAAQKAADQYLLNVKKMAEVEQVEKKDNRIPFDCARRSGIRKTAGSQTEQILKAVSGDERG